MELDHLTTFSIYMKVFLEEILDQSSTKLGEAWYMVTLIPTFQWLGEISNQARL